MSNRKSLAAFGGKYEEAVTAKDFFRLHVEITPELKNLATEMYKRLQKGERITREMAEIITPYIVRLNATNVDPHLFMNLTGTNLAIRQLSELYAQYVRECLKSNKIPDQVHQWVFSSARGRSLELLTKLCGEKFRDIFKVESKMALARWIPIESPLRMSLLAGNLCDELYLTLKKYNQLLMSRLDDIPAAQFSRTHFPVGHYRILQGNMGEILALEKVFPLLEEIRERSGNGNNIAIILGAKWRVPGGSKQLMSDMIIGEMKGQTFDIHLHVEVKTSRMGELAGLEQAHRSIETRLSTSGAQLIFDSGTSVVTDREVIAPFSTTKGKEQVFHFGSKTPHRNTVSNVNSADRVIIYPKGENMPDNPVGLLPGAYRPIPFDLTYLELRSLLSYVAKWFKVDDVLEK